MERGLSFCVVGEIGSGKTTTVEYLRRKFPEHELVTSSRLWNGVAGREMTHEEAAVFQRDVIAREGEGFHTRLLIGKIESSLSADPSRRFIVDGIRSQENFDALKRLFGGKMLFIGMLADKGTRRGRISSRDGGDGFEERQRLEDSQFPIASMVEQCDVRIVNDFPDKESLFREIDRAVGGA